MCPCSPPADPLRKSFTPSQINLHFLFPQVSTSPPVRRACFVVWSDVTASESPADNQSNAAAELLSGALAGLKRSIRFCGWRPHGKRSAPWISAVLLWSIFLDLIFVAGARRRLHAKADWHQCAPAAAPLRLPSTPSTRTPLRVSGCSRRYAALGFRWTRRGLRVAEAAPGTGDDAASSRQ